MHHDRSRDLPPPAHDHPTRLAPAHRLGEPDCPAGQVLTITNEGQHVLRPGRDRDALRVATHLCFLPWRDHPATRFDRSPHPFVTAERADAVRPHAHTPAT